MRRQLEFTANKITGWVRLWLTAHLKVIDALQEGDLQRAAATMSAHLQQAYQSAVAMFR
jgi:DNA-binding GntR family transcriptional regulator